MENLSKVKDLLSEFYKIFSEKPFDYLYESDVQTELTSMLKSRFNPIKVETINEEFLINKPFYFSLVKNEYYKLDIAILENQIKINPQKHEKYGKNEMFLYWQTVDIAIELKLNYIYSNMAKEFSDDVDELNLLLNFSDEERRINTGIALILFQKKEDFKRYKDNYKNCDVIESEHDAINLSVGKVNCLVFVPNQ
jgi:hypothetical protein